MKISAACLYLALTCHVAIAVPLTSDTIINARLDQPQIGGRDTNQADMMPGMPGLPGLGGGGAGGPNPFVAGNGLVDGLTRLVNGLLGQPQIGGRDINQADMMPGMGFPGLGGGGAGGPNPFVAGNGLVDGLTRLVNGLLGQPQIGGRDVNQADMMPGMPGLPGLGGGGAGGSSPFIPGNGLVEGLTRLVNGLLGQPQIGPRALDAQRIEELQGLLQRLEEYRSRSPSTATITA